MSSVKRTDKTKMQLVESDDSDEDFMDDDDERVETLPMDSDVEVQSRSTMSAIKDRTKDSDLDDSDSDEEDETVIKDMKKNKVKTDLNIENDSESGSDDASGVEQKKTASQVPERLSRIEQQYSEIRKEISNLPFEDLLKLKNKMGLKLFNQIFYGKKHKDPQPIPKRANKNRPQELSSKKPPKRNRTSKAKMESRVRDPRFDERSGQFDEEHFKQSYGFINDIKEREKVKLKKMFSKEKNSDKKQKLAYLLNRLNQQEDSKRKKEKSLELKRKIKKAEREDVVKGQTPFYLKKSDQKKLELAEKFRELKKSGKLEKFMSKKRKKLAQKDRRKMPDF